jgi:hypothetical protein
VIAVPVLEHGILDNRFVQAAGGDDGNLGLQRDELLDDRFLVSDGIPDVRDIGLRGDLVLPLAVVAVVGRLDNGRRADAGDGIPQLVERGRARCCAVCSAAADGRTGASASMASMAPIGTFSNSKVTTSTLPANARSASTSS